MDEYKIGDIVAIEHARDYNPSYESIINTAYGKVENIYSSKVLIPTTNIPICKCGGKEVHISEGNKHLRRPNLLEKIFIDFSK